MNQKMPTVKFPYLPLQVLASLLIACWGKDLVAQDSYVWPVEMFPRGKEYQDAERVNEYYAPEHDVYYDNRIGRHGLGFEKRYARASGLRMPITEDSIQHVGYRLLKKEDIYTPL